MQCVHICWSVQGKLGGKIRIVKGKGHGGVEGNKQAEKGAPSSLSSERSPLLPSFPRSAS